MAWQNQFQNLLGRPPLGSERLRDLPVINRGEIRDSEFTRDEYRKVVNTMAEGRNGGADGIRPEVLKRGGEELDSIERVVLGLCNTPTQWCLYLKVAH